MGIVVKVLNSRQWAVAKEALLKAGLMKGRPEKTSNTQEFLAQLEDAFPEVYKGIRDGILIAKSKDMSGGDKAVAIAVDVLKTAPSVLQNVPGVKDAMVAAVTSVFADEVSSFGRVVLKNLLK